MPLCSSPLWLSFWDHSFKIGEDLEQTGYQGTRADSGEQAVRLLKKAGYDLVITDLAVEKTDGIQVLKKTKEKFGLIPEFCTQIAHSKVRD
jgi:DNA-binding response OmpR family regulator